MTHELKNIFEGYAQAQCKGLSAVIATVVDLDGSSYRRPGVRMLILSDGHMIGAVSGGCVEKEIIRQSEDIFRTGKSKMMIYDGRYRLGCEGVLYILLEPFMPNIATISAFNECLESRQAFEVISYYEKAEGSISGIGSIIRFSNGEKYSLAKQNHYLSNGHHSTLSVFTQKMTSCLKLVIFGAEHDAVQLCSLASLMGWEVTILSAPDDPKSVTHFPGAKKVCALPFDELSKAKIDKYTAVVVMTHSFSSDLKYLTHLKGLDLAYLGLLGPVDRKEKLLSQLLEHDFDIKEEFLENIHGPAGINIGSETPQEIAVSIISEILAVIRNQQPMKLSEKLGRIHS